jgi:hypothetical protein
MPPSAPYTASPTAVLPQGPLRGQAQVQTQVQEQVRAQAQAKAQVLELEQGRSWWKERWGRRNRALQGPCQSPPCHEAERCKHLAVQYKYMTYTQKSPHGVFFCGRSDVFSSVVDDTNATVGVALVRILNLPDELEFLFFVVINWLRLGRRRFFLAGRLVENNRPALFK